MQSKQILFKKRKGKRNVLAWRIPGTAEPRGLPSMGSHRVRHDWSNPAAAAAITATETLWLTKSILFANTAFREKVCQFLTFIYDLMQFADILFQNFASTFMKYIVLHFSFLNAMVYFWYHDNLSFIKWVGKYSHLLNVEWILLLPLNLYMGNKMGP